MSKKASRLRNDANKAVKRGKYQKALDAYLALEALESHDGGWARRAADMHKRLGEASAFVAALERAADKYANAGFLVKAVAVCKMILQADASHVATRQRLAALQEKRGLSSPAPTQATTQVPPAIADEDNMEPLVEIASQPPPVPRKTRTIPPGMPLEVVQLRDVVPDARPELRADGSASGLTEIPLELADIDFELPLVEVEPDDDEAGRESAFARDAALRLAQTPLFAALNPASLDRLINGVELVEVEPGQVLFRQGEPARQLFVIVEGEVAVMSEGPPSVELSRLHEGDFFGEIGLVTEQPRTASIVAAGDELLQVLAISRDTVGDMVEEQPGVLTLLLRFLRDRLVDNLIRTSALFEPFIGDDRRQLVSKFQFLEVEQGSVVIRQGERATGLYVLLSGLADVTIVGGDSTRNVTVLKPGDLFGEMSLLSQEPAVATVRTRGKCFCLRLPADQFRQVIMTHPQVLMFVGELAETRKRQVSEIAGGGAPYDEGHLALL